MADKITNDITLLFKTKLDEKSKQEIGKNLKGLLENAAIGFDEAETKRNVEPIIQMIKRLFDKAEIAFDADKLLAMPSRKALEEMAKIEVNQLQLAFDKALAKSGGVKIDFGDIGLSELASPLKQIESELSDISKKVADTTKKSVYEIEQSLKSVSKNKSFKKIASPESIENTLIESSNDKKIHPSRAATQLEKARDLYDKSVKEDNPWVVQYKYLLDFVSKYEKLTHQAKTKIEAERPEFKQLYDMLSPKAGAVKISLEHYVDVAKGNELSEYKNQPWGRESTLKEIRDTLKGGISVKEGSGEDNNHKDNTAPPWEDKNEDVKPKTPNTKVPAIDNADVNAAEQAKKAEEERLRIAEQRRIEQEKIAEMLKKESEATPDTSAFNQKLFDGIEKLSNDIEVAFKSMMNGDIDEDQFDDQLAELRGEFLKQFKFDGKQRIDDYLAEKSDNMGEWNSKKIYDRLSKKLSPNDPSWPRIEASVADTKESATAHDNLQTILTDMNKFLSSNQDKKIKDYFDLIAAGAYEMSDDVKSAIEATIGSVDSLNSINIGANNHGGLIGDKNALIMRESWIDSNDATELQSRLGGINTPNVNLGKTQELIKTEEYLVDLQNRVSGDPISTIGEAIEDVNPNVLNATTTSIQSLVQAMRELYNAGVEVDVENLGNILYDGKSDQFGIVDMGIKNGVREFESFEEMLRAFASTVRNQVEDITNVLNNPDMAQAWSRFADMVDGVVGVKTGTIPNKEIIENADNNAEIAAEKAETDAINQQNEALKENIDLKTKANAQDSSNHILSSLTKLEEITNKSLSEVINDYDNLDNSIKQNVDSILQSIGLMGSDGQFLFDRKQGGNAKAFVTDNFVILQKHITTNNEEIGIFIEKLQQAKQEGIQLAEVLGQTFSLNAKEDIGFRKGYEIQERGEGSEVHASPKLIDLNQALAENQKILNLSDEHLQKFILDYIKLDQIGLQIDPSKPSNFLLDAEKGITFIDIGLKDVNAKAKSTADIFTEIATILSNMVGYMKFGENGDWSKSSGQIVNRIRDIFTQLNLSSGEEMNKIIEERFIRNNDMKSVLLPENTNISADSSEVKASIDTEELRGLLNSITYNVKVIQDAEPVEGNKVSINADELRSVLDGITYNVKLAQGETDGDSNKIAIDEGILENVLNRITYDVKIAHDDADKTSNKIAIDESALEGVLNRVFGNILAPKDEGKKPEGKKEPWALEKTLNTTIQGVLDQIQTNTAKVDATSDTTGISEIKSILESINAKIVKGGVIATRGAVKQAGAQAVEPDVKRQAARSNMMKSIINDYKTMGKLAAQFASDGNLETKAMLENLKEEIRRKRSSLNITMDENANLREKYSIAFEAEKRLLEAEKQQRKINEKNKTDAKAEKKKLADAKKLAQREAMVGKAGNAVSRAENTWMTAAGMEDALPKDFDAKLDDYYHKLDALRKKQAELKNSDVISEEDKADLIYQTNNVNKLTDEISGLIAEYQKLSGSNATVIGTNTLGADAGIGAYEQQLKRAVMTATNGKAQIKGFDAATKTLTYTVKTGKNEFTQYTAAVRNLDGQLVAVQGTTKRTETFLEATKRKMKEITSYMSGMALLSRAGQELRRGIQYVRDIDLALTELKKVTDETEESYERFLDTAAKTADKVGSTIQKVVSSTADWARLNI